MSPNHGSSKPRKAHRKRHYITFQDKEHSINNLCLGFDHELGVYDVPSQLYAPCDSFTAEHIALAKRVQAGFVSLKTLRFERFPELGGPQVSAGILVAKAWVRHTSESVLVWGPMMAYYVSKGWDIRFDECRAQSPRVEGEHLGTIHCDRSSS